MKKYRLELELVGIYSKYFAGNDFNKSDFYWVLGYENVSILSEDDSDEAFTVKLEHLGIKIVIDYFRPDTIELHRIYYKGEFNEKG